MKTLLLVVDTIATIALITTITFIVFVGKENWVLTVLFSGTTITLLWLDLMILRARVLMGSKKELDEINEILSGKIESNDYE